LAKKAGAWVWEIQMANKIDWVGSSYPATECVKKDIVLIADNNGDIIPEKNEV